MSVVAAFTSICFCLRSMKLHKVLISFILLYIYIQQSFLLKKIEGNAADKFIYNYLSLIIYGMTLFFHYLLLFIRESFKTLLTGI